LSFIPLALKNGERLYNMFILIFEPLFLARLSTDIIHKISSMLTADTVLVLSNREANPQAAKLWIYYLQLHLVHDSIAG